MFFLFQTIGAFFGSAIIFGMYYGKTRPGRAARFNSNSNGLYS